MRGKKKGTAADAYDESERTIAAEDAHRDFTYCLPSSFSQIRTCYSMQMKMFSKRRLFNLFFLILLLAIPAVVYFAPASFTFSTANENMAIVLCLLPLLSAAIACTSCGKMLPREYHERTIYLTAPLPMNKSSLYVGKFLAGFVLASAKVLLVYGMALISCRFLLQWNAVYYVPILMSLAISICAVFFYCSFAYMTSTFLKRGSTAIPFVLIVFAMTGIVYAVALLAASYDIPVIPDIIGYMPSLSCDSALSYLGSSTGYGLYGILGLLPQKLNGSFILGSNLIAICALDLILGIICLAIGERRIERRGI